MKRLFSALFLLCFSSPMQAADLQQLLQLIDYVGVDYAEAVSGGEVINAAEYAEMQDFSAGIARQVVGLPENARKASLVAQSQRLSRLVDARAAPAEVNALTGDMRRAIIEGWNVTVVPRQPPDLARAEKLYSQQCAGCHGAEGDGRGPLARGMEPPPIDFRDRARYRQRTLYGLYNTTTQGVAGTAMPAFSELSAADRWSLAFYVGQLAVEEPVSDAAALLEDERLAPLRDLGRLTVTTPAEAIEKYGPEGEALMAYLRSHPAELFAGQSPLRFSRQRLDAVLQAYRAGDRQLAYQHAVEAYLEGFELVEQGLNAVDAGLRLDIEQAMTGLRARIRDGAPVAEVESAVAEIKAKLYLAAERLDGRSLSGAAAFAGAFFILLREGLEALLVVAALAAFLVK
ncbi:MAG: cytochrome c, partial [Gammaproteobacteria bacterium]